MTVEENKAIARRWMEEIWQEASAAAVDELLAPDFVFHYAPPGAEPDREAYKQMLDDMLASLPDIEFTTEDIVVGEDKVAVHWIGRGTHKGEFWGAAPTGEQVTMRGISILRIEGGRIVEEWGYDNCWWALASEE